MIKVPNMTDIFTLYLGQPVLHEVSNKLLERLNRQTTHFENHIYQNLEVVIASLLVGIEAIILFVDLLLEFGVKAAFEQLPRPDT
jgi:hypothetical protein